MEKGGENMLCSQTSLRLKTLSFNSLNTASVE